MNTRKVINIVAIAAGLILGPSSLSSAKAAQPPLTWESILFALVGSIVAGIIVIGFQIIRKNKKYGYTALRFFEPIAIFVLCSGITAFGYSVFLNEIIPPSVLFLALGVGLILSVVVSSVIYKLRFKNAL